MSTKVIGSTSFKRKNNVRWKKNKHQFHQLYGCKRYSCLICCHGFPMQMYYNNVDKRWVQ